MTASILFRIGQPSSIHALLSRAVKTNSISLAPDYRKGCGKNSAHSCDEAYEQRGEAVPLVVSRAHSAASSHPTLKVLVASRKSNLRWRQ